MDIFSHGLWAAAAYKAADGKKRFNLWKAAFWGVFPDLFAFTISFLWLFGNFVFGDLSFADLPRPDEIEPASDALMFGDGDIGKATSFIARVTAILYHLSHSAVVFLVIFGLVYLIFRRPIWELGGWLMHIFLDIPTHQYQVYPTPVLWPLSGWKFDGFSWETLWFLVPNYIAIIFVYLLLRNKRG